LLAQLIILLGGIPTMQTIVRAEIFLAVVDAVTTLHQRVTDGTFSVFLLAYIHDMLTQSSRDNALFFGVLHALCAGARPTRSLCVARVAVLAVRDKIRVRVVRPDVCRFHAPLLHGLIQLVFAVGDGVPGETLHPHHVPHCGARVLDEPVFRI
jgi:hypothetical protein